MLSDLDELPKSLIHLPLLAEILNNWASFLKMYSFEEFWKILVLTTFGAEGVSEALFLFCHF